MGRALCWVGHAKPRGQLRRVLVCLLAFVHWQAVDCCLSPDESSLGPCIYYDHTSPTIGLGEPFTLTPTSQSCALVPGFDQLSAVIQVGGSRRRPFGGRSYLPTHPPPHHRPTASPLHATPCHFSSFVALMLLLLRRRTEACPPPASKRCCCPPACPWTQQRASSLAP